MKFEVGAVERPLTTVTGLIENVILEASHKSCDDDDDEMAKTTVNQRILSSQVASHASKLEGVVVKTIVCETNALTVVTQLLLLSLVLAPARPT